MSTLIYSITRQDYHTKGYFPMENISNINPKAPKNNMYRKYLIVFNIFVACSKSNILARKKRCSSCKYNALHSPILLRLVQSIFLNK